ncbi:MAG: hypothetical protein CO095_02970 [Armatimonadetes bacterium CG_4_9_14_3_um_filter_58_7]|nr:MAG: hypothetical protein CO095_02970 [Armatimonadetes bacterium CG_4_9_14_3_um_filter_58_7]
MTPIQSVPTHRDALQKEQLAETSRWLGECHFDREEGDEAAEYLNQYAVWECLVRQTIVSVSSPSGKQTGLSASQPKPDATALYHLRRSYERLNNPTAALAAASRKRLDRLNTPGKQRGNQLASTQSGTTGVA